MQPLVRQTKACIGITPGYNVSRSIEDFNQNSSQVRLVDSILLDYESTFAASHKYCIF